MCCNSRVRRVQPDRVVKQEHSQLYLRRYPKVLVPELNLGQLAKVLRDRYLLDVISLPKIQGLPFKVSEIRAAINEALA